MINLYFDLDDVVFDFSRDFIRFVNDLYNKEYIKLLPNPKAFTPIEVFGIEEEIFRPLLDKYIELAQFEHQPLMPHAFEALTYVNNYVGIKFNTPNFITVRDPESIIHTISRLQTVYEYIKYNPLEGFKLFSANSKHHKKWQIIKELSKYNSEGIFIDDHPDYINDVVSHCPGVITFWMNSVGVHNGAHPHYTITDWQQFISLVDDKSYSELLKDSNHPGVQMEIR